METNKAILEKLVKLGKEIFNTIDINTGTYTAAELVKANQTGKGNPRNIWYYFSDGEGKRKVSISHKSFGAQFEAQNIWYYIWKFEQLVGVKQSEKARFTRVEETVSAPVCTFKVDIPERCDKLKSLVSADKYRPNLCKVSLCPELGSIVATDGIVMRWYNVQFFDYTGEQCRYIYIEPKDITRLAGVCSVSVYKEGETYKTIVTSPSNEVFTCSCGHRNPNFSSVIPKVSRDGYIQVEKKSIKDLLSLCKIALKSSKEANLLIHITSGANVMQVSSGDLSASISLCSAAKFNGVLCLLASSVVKISTGWDGGMWIAGCDMPVVFDNNNVNGLDLISTLFHEDIKCDSINGDTNALERYNPINDKPSGSPSIIEDAEPKEALEQTKNVPSIYIAPCSAVLMYIELLAFLMYSFRNWLFEYETSKALSRLEFLDSFKIPCNAPDKEECPIPVESECISLSDETNDSPKYPGHCGTGKIQYSTPICIGGFSLVFFVLLVVAVSILLLLTPSIVWACSLRTKVTQRIRDGTLIQTIRQCSVHLVYIKWVNRME